MRTRMLALSFFLLVIGFCINETSALPAFPGAQGWGAETAGGRGGKVYVVTNLNSSGPGSLLQGILMREPRIIVFRVSGVINLGVNAGMLAESNSHLTIAGQTSPGGITLRNSGGYSWVSYGIDFHDFVFRYLRFRSVNADDGIQFGPSHHFVIDHCDFSGGEDETTDFYYCYYFTVQWSTIANSERANSKGTIIAGRGDHITFHHNLWAHHMERTPAFFWDNEPPDHGLIDFRNNIIYDIDDYSTLFAGLDWAPGGEGRANIVGNVWKEGPNMGGTNVAYGPYFYHTVKVFDADNCFNLKDGSNFGCDKLVLRYGAANRATAPWATPAVTTTSSAQAYDDVLAMAGALPKDSMNRRVERDVRTGTGADLIVTDPLLTTGPEPPADGDMDGMPDCWESAMGLNPNAASDNNGDHDGDGYTNIEEYINDVALTLTGEAVHNVPLESGCPSATEVMPASSPGRFADPLIFPNPAGNEVLISLQKGDIAVRLALHSISGGLVWDFGALAGQRITIRRPTHIPSGVYLLRIRTETHLFSKKIVLH